MTELATLFVEPIALSGLQRVLLLLPICLSISVVYKTIKCPNVRDIPMASLGLCASMLLGMWAVAVALWLLYLFFA